MAIDSNVSDEDRGATGAGDRSWASSLKLVGGRSAPSGAAAASDVGPSPSMGTGDPASGPGVATRRARGSGRRLPAWSFVALVVLFLTALGYQSYHAGQLADQVARLEASLADAEGRLESHRTHLLEIRGGVHDLSGRLEALRALVDRDPTAAGAEGRPEAGANDTSTP